MAQDASERMGSAKQIEMNQRTAVIIGYGNPLRGDDGVGWHIAQHLATLHAHHGIVRSRDVQIQVIPCLQLTPELAEPVSQADDVIFIDASMQTPAGTLVRKRIVAAPHVLGAFTHYLEPATLLTIAQLLYGSRPATATLYQVTGECFEGIEQLSPTVQSLVPVLENAIIDHIKQIAARAAARPEG